MLKILEERWIVRGLQTFCLNQQPQEPGYKIAYELILFYMDAEMKSLN